MYSEVSNAIITFCRRPYDYFFGGVVAILKEHFVMVNGFSNMFWGWGNEDDNFRDRSEVKIYRC